MINVPCPIPVVGLEPTRPRGHGILNPARLPIPPHRQNYMNWQAFPVHLKGQTATCR